MGFEDAIKIVVETAATENVFLDTVNLVMSSGKTSSENIGALLSIAGSAFDFDIVDIKKIMERGAVVKCIQEWNRRGPSLIKGAERRFLATTLNSIKREYEKNGGYYLWNNTDEIPCIMQIIESECVVSLISLPLYSKGQLIGGIEFIDSRKNRSKDDPIIEVLKKFADSLSEAVAGNDNLETNAEIISEITSRDRLTNLPKFDEFLRFVEKSVENDKKHSYAIVSVDVSNFKYINEKFGYNVGDMFLKLLPISMYEHFSRIISSCREYSDIFLFAVRFRSEITNEEVYDAVNATNLDFLAKVKPMIGDTNVAVNSGFCVVKNNEISVDEAITYATAARKASKNTTVLMGSRCIAYERKMTEDFVKAFDLVADCDKAIENNEFKVYLQPKVRCKDYRIVGAEALIRWKKSDGRFVYPDEFIPAFEENGCIVKTDYYVYETVFKFLRERIDKGLYCVPISMNVSRIHLYNTGFIEYLDQLMDKYEIPSEYLEFEITENICLEKLPTAKFTIQWLRKMNIKVSIDDFGSGYSSLDILTRLPINILKLDKIFMKEKLEGKDRILISSIVEMARKLGLEVICEGVEDEHQRKFLVEACCEKLQGYIFSKPVPMEEFTDMLDSEQGGLLR